jgi:hypothetical protein
MKHRSLHAMRQFTHQVGRHDEAIITEHYQGE